MKNKFLFSFLLLICNLSIFPQNKKNISSQGQTLDSLKQALREVKHDTTLSRLFNKIGDCYENEKPDSAVYYYQLSFNTAAKHGSGEGIIIYNNFRLLKSRALLNIGIVNASKGNHPKALENYSKALIILEEICTSKDKTLLSDAKTGIASCYGNFGSSYTNQGNYTKALEYFQKSLQINEALKKKIGMANCYNSMGMINNIQGNYTQALQCFLNSLKICEALNDKVGISTCYTNIGTVHDNQDNYQRALEYYQKSLKIKEETGDKKGMSNCYNNIGTKYYTLGNYEQALEYFLKSLKIKEELGYKQGVATCLVNIGSVYKKQKKFVQSLKYYYESLNNFKEINDRKSMALVYANIAHLQNELKDYDKAITFALKGLQIAREIGALQEQNKMYFHLKEAYKNLHDYKKAAEYSELFIAVKDSLYNDERIKALTEMEEKYKAEKKEHTISLLENEKKIQSLEIKNLHEKKRNQLIVLIFLLLIIIGISVLFFLRYRYKQKIVSERKMADLRKSQFKEVIESQEKERKRIAGDLHDSIGQILTTAKLNLSVLEDYIELNGEDEKKIYSNSLQLINDACIEVRSISHNLMPGVLIKLGLVSAVRELIDKLTSAHLLWIDLSVDGFSVALGEIQEINFFRLLQELLNNTVKHSKATLITIELKNDEKFVYLLFTDNGTGFDTAQIKNSKGIGWDNIFSRVAMLNGNIDIKSDTGKGSQINIVFALNS